MASGTIGDINIVVDRVTNGKGVSVTILCSIHGVWLDSSQTGSGVPDENIVRVSLREFRELRSCGCSFGKAQRVVTSLETIMIDGAN